MKLGVKKTPPKRKSLAASKFEEEQEQAAKRMRGFSARMWPAPLADANEQFESISNLKLRWEDQLQNFEACPLGGGLRPRKPPPLRPGAILTPARSL